MPVKQPFQKKSIQKRRLEIWAYSTTGSPSLSEARYVSTFFGSTNGHVVVGVGGLGFQEYTQVTNPFHFRGIAGIQNQPTP